MKKNRMAYYELMPGEYSYFSQFKDDPANGEQLCPKFGFLIGFENISQIETLGKRLVGYADEMRKAKEKGCPYLIGETETDSSN